MPVEVVRTRVQRLRHASGAWARAFHRRFDGATAQVMCESRNERTGEWESYTERYIPVRFKAPADGRGRILTLKLSHPSAAGLRGTVVAS